MFDVFPTMITPYLENGQIDFEAVDRYVQWYYDHDATGIFAICQSSEIFWLSLEERVQLNRRVWEKTQEIKKQTGKSLTVVSSGHVSCDLKAQAYELNAVCDSGTDALIFITNRLDPHHEGDDTFIRNGEWLLSQLPQDVKLGLYECPYPYKRLITPRLFDWCLSTGRFYYMKDTCCNLDMLRDRGKQVKDTQFALLNANCQTLLASMEMGAKGYCGVMGNLHPQLYTRMCRLFEEGNVGEARKLQHLIGTIGFIECQEYPLSAKYHMALEGIPSALITRSVPTARLSEYGKHCVRQIKALTDQVTEGVF